MRGRFASTLAAAAVVALVLAAPASADFGFEHLDVIMTTGPDGSPAMQAGSHPFAMTTRVDLNVDPESGDPEGSPKDLFVDLPPGFVGDPTAVSRCSIVDFLTLHPDGPLEFTPSCPDSSAVGFIRIVADVGGVGGTGSGKEAGVVYNLAPPPGVAAKLGFRVLGTFTTINLGVRPGGEHNIYASLANLQQIEPIAGSVFTVWGNPADPAHDSQRGGCFITDDGPPDSCPVNIPIEPFLTMPTRCTGPLTTLFEMNSWQDPGVFVKGKAETHDDSEPPSPLGTFGCSQLDFAPRTSSRPSTDQAESSTGLDFDLDITDEGLVNPDGIAQSHIKKAVVTLPEGVTINPSIGEGLGVCTPADLGRETISSAPGVGCPSASKMGTVHVDTPLIDEAIEGEVFLAQQDDPGTSTPGAENPFDSLIAFYIVLKNANLGVLVKLPAKVEPDPKTGQLITTLDDAPQFPFSHFNFHFRVGQRAPLVTPPACGTYTTEAELTPWSDPSSPRTVTSTFQITRGIGGGPCPPGGVPPFKPGFQAGSINNNAGSHSPFYLRLIRSDGEQDMTKISSVLPPGELGTLAGVDKCPDAAVEAAKAKTGRQELASPSCPANSLIGHSLAGAGVGSALTYVGGQIYLGGPYKGDPLSVISVTPAVAGPFDAGTVVVRLALTLNPETAEVEVDGAVSDPIPHILQGIVLKVRDLRVYVDRPNFTLNPTSCDPSKVRATLFGGFLDVFSPLDDVPVDLSTRFQAANCLNLAYKPRLKLNLRGGAKRGDHPGLKAVFTPRPGDANTAMARVTLPRSAFLEQGHIRTICTRVQFAANQCPSGSIYGHAKAITPLLEEPVEGPVILRSSTNKLPDLVLALKGLVDVNVSSRIDSFKGGIRNTFEVVPDAPVTKFTLTLQGGDKGLIVNSRDLCKGKTSRVNARFTAHNGRVRTLHPELEPQCGGKR